MFVLKVKLVDSLAEQVVLSEVEDVKGKMRSMRTLFVSIVKWDLKYLDIACDEILYRFQWLDIQESVSLMCNDLSLLIPVFPTSPFTSLIIGSNDTIIL